MSKSIYEEVLEALSILVKQVNIKIESLNPLIKKAEKKIKRNEKLLELYKELEHIRLELSVKDEPNEVIHLVKSAMEIKQQIKELENE